MKCGLYLVLGVALGLTMANAAVAQDAGGAAPAASPACADQASGGGKAGADVDMLYAPKAKGAKGVSAGVRPPAAAKPPAPPQVAAKPSATAPATSVAPATPVARTGGPGMAPPTAPGSVAVAPRAIPNHAAANAMPVGGSVINGTTLSRPAARPASVGGSTKGTVGVLSGNSFAPKHP